MLTKDMIKFIVMTIFVLLPLAVFAQTETTAQPPSNYGQESAGLSEDNPYLIANLANLRWLLETQTPHKQTANNNIFKKIEKPLDKKNNYIFLLVKVNL
jgi:hypothetical protein